MNYFEAIEIAKEFDEKPERLLLGMPEPHSLGTAANGVNSYRYHPIINVFHPKRDDFTAALRKSVEEGSSLWPDFLCPKFKSFVNFSNLGEVLAPYGVRLVKFKYRSPTILVFPDDTVMLYKGNSGLYTAVGFAIKYGMDVVGVLKSVPGRKGELKC